MSTLVTDLDWRERVSREWRAKVAECERETSGNYIEAVALASKRFPDMRPSCRHAQGPAEAPPRQATSGKSTEQLLAEIAEKEQALAELKRPRLTAAQAREQFREKVAACLKETRGDQARAFALARQRHPELVAAVNQAPAAAAPPPQPRRVTVERSNPHFQQGQRPVNPSYDAWRAKVDECTRECGGNRERGFLLAAKRYPELATAARG